MISPVACARLAKQMIDDGERRLCVSHPSKVIWNPSARAIEITKALRAAGFNVLSTDVDDPDSDSIDKDGEIDFLDVEMIQPDIELIVACPPKSVSLYAWIDHAIELTRPSRGGVLFLVRAEAREFKGVIERCRAPFCCAFELEGAPFVWLYWDWRADAQSSKRRVKMRSLEDSPCRLAV